METLSSTSSPTPKMETLNARSLFRFLDMGILEQDIVFKEYSDTPESLIKQIIFQYTDGIVRANNYKNFTEMPVSLQEKFREIQKKLLQEVIKDTPPDNIKSVRISRAGTLKMVDISGKITEINLVEKWNELAQIEKKQVTQKSAQQIEQLQQQVSQEKFLNNSVIAEMVPLDTIWDYATSGILLGAVGVSTALSAPALTKEVYFATKSLVINTVDGAKRIRFKKPYIGTKAEIRNNIGKILQTVYQSDGYGYNAEIKKFTNPERTALKKMHEKFEKLTLKDYQKAASSNPDLKQIKNQAEFDAFKTEMLRASRGTFEKIAQGVLSPKNGVRMLKSVIPTSLGEIFFWPMFFHELHHNQTPAGAVKSLTSMVTFHAGSKVAGVALATRIGSKLPGWAKFVGPLLAGGAAVYYGDEFLEKQLEISRQKWKYTQKSNYSDGRSAMLHMYTGFGISEAWNGAQNLLGITNKKDIGIPSFHVNNPFTGKNIFTMPEITLYQSKINLATAPEQWISSSAGRDINDWNKEVDIYVTVLTGDIYSLIRDYHRNAPVFAEAKNETEKKQIFAQQLHELMSKGGDSHIFSYQMESIANAVLAELWNVNTKNPSNAVINDTIRMSVNSMKIDDFYWAQRKQERENFEIDMLRSRLAELSDDAKTQEFLQKIPDRMKFGEDLTQTSEEKKIFEALIDNDEPIKQDSQSIKKWQYFANILDHLVDWKKEWEFLQQLDKGNARGFRWNL